MNAIKAWWLCYQFSFEKKKKTQQIFYHFKNFVVKLKKIFENSKKKATTKRNLFKLKQLSSMIIYASEFQTLTYKINWHENILIARFLKRLRKNVYTVMTFINQSKTLIETIIIITRIDNRLYQVRTNNRNLETQKNITLNMQRDDSMNLNAN